MEKSTIFLIGFLIGAFFGILITVNDIAITNVEHDAKNSEYIVQYYVLDSKYNKTIDD